MPQAGWYHGVPFVPDRMRGIYFSYNDPFLDERDAMKESSMTSESSQPLNWKFLIAWVAVGLIGALLWVVAFVVGAYLITPLMSSGAFLPVGFSISFGCVGYIVGIMQKFVLRRWGHKSFQWVLHTTYGAAIGGTIYATIISLSLPIRFQSVILGVSVGLIQWKDLNKFSRRAGLWVMASTIGGLLDDIITPGIFGLLSGVVTGLAMLWLLRHPIQRPDQPILSSGSSV